MAARRYLSTARDNERGVSLLMIAAAMIFVLGMAGLSIDLASMYVARSQAQRAADAAALAGARALVDCGGASGDNQTLSGTCMQYAMEKAEAAGNLNLVAGVSPTIQDGDISFPSQSTNDPQIQVVAGRGTYDGIDHGNALPTFFMKIFGINSTNISATAIAEAYNPSGTGGQIGASCVKPWMFPNCDQFNTTIQAPSPNCSGGYGPFVDRLNGTGQVLRPENYPNGAIGEPYVIKPGNVTGAAAPGQFYAAYLPSSSSVPTECPSCATVVSQGGSGSGALYRANIECCNTNKLYCGETVYLNTTLQSNPGNMVGPTYQGVNCMIHQDKIYGSSNCGQDYIQGTSQSSACTDPPSQNASGLPQLPQIPPLIMPGANNPFDPSGTSPIPWSSSNSVIVAPIYDGIIQSGQNWVQIAGFVQLFIRDAAKNQQGTIYAYVLGISGCGNGVGGGGSNGGGGGTVPVADGGSAVPIRLIHR